MIDLDKVWLAILLAIIAGGIFMLGVGLGYATGHDRQVEKQKTLLIEQNKLLKENIELNNEILKLKKEER